MTRTITVNADLPKVKKLKNKSQILQLFILLIKKDEKGFLNWLIVVFN